jgi:Ser-tRNA(Ala) deacylase AlaX
MYALVRCQYEPLLRSLAGVTVKACTPKQEKNTSFFEVELSETILYPEGGGQPFDLGTLKGEIDSIAVTAVYHTADGRVAHKTDKPLEVGTQVEVHVDWTRRFDHMQQHSAQHLLSAIAFRRFGWATHSWWLASAPEPCHIEFTTERVSDEELQQFENEANQLIREAHAMNVRYYQTEAEYESGLDSTGLVIRKKAAAVEPAEEAGPAAPGVAIRVMEIEGVDFNKCGGTHLSNTAQLQLVKLVSTAKSRANTRIFFVAGERALNTFDSAFQTCKNVGALMACGQDKFVDNIKRMQTDSRDTSKLLSARNEELCALLAEKLVSSTSSDQPIVSFREGAALSFLSTLAEAIQPLNKAALPLLLMGSQEFLVNGPEALVTTHGPAVAKALGAKAGGRKGVMQGKAPVPFSQEQRDEAIRVLSDAMRA